MAFEPIDLLSSAPSNLGERPVLLAYSGGLDSTVLLDALAGLGLPRLRAAHVHHGLQAVAEGWIEHCRGECENRSVPFELLRVRIAEQSPAGPEAAAREARYAALRDLMQAGEVLVTAHHGDDQAETFLMHAMRGAGPRGLGAMPALQDFAPGLLWRPMLGLHRDDLSRYATARGLRWVEDPHNRDPRYERAWLRSEVLPVLRRRWPSVATTLARSAALCAEADGLLAALATMDAGGAQRGEVLSVTALKTLSPGRRNNLLRGWIAGPRGLSLPPHTLLGQIDDLLDARCDAEPCMAWSGGELRRYRDDLHAIKALPPLPDGFEAEWNGLGNLPLPVGCGLLIAPPEAGPRELLVQLPRGGERLRLAPDRPRQRLKNLFQDHAVPPWRRSRTPLVFEAGVLRWVGGLPLPEQDDAFYAALRWDADR